jgi:hypothetical protein
MGGKATPRHLTLPLRKFRDYMLGRKYINNLRFYEYDMVPKSQPQPNLPPGPHDQLSGVPYYARDARNFKASENYISDVKRGARISFVEKIFYNHILFHLLLIYFLFYLFLLF